MKRMILEVKIRILREAFVFTAIALFASGGSVAVGRAGERLLLRTIDLERARDAHVLLGV
jgi:hypothetical protein